MAKYFGRDGLPCQRSEWSRLRSDRDYRIVKEYDNGQVYVCLEWLGEVADTSTFRDCWKMFALCVGNYNANGDNHAGNYHPTWKLTYLTPNTK